MRIYLPLTLERLADLAAAGEVREPEEPFVAEGEDEDSEYAALMSAADVSASLQPSGARRVVVVAEVGREGDPVLLRHVLAVHADVAGARPDDDLAWFATQEIPDLLA
ncbi:MAG: hypothetical protein JWR42_1016 [Marmoricola sp.]|nr:hypothetical protein [Marmoricola sp.]